MNQTCRDSNTSRVFFKHHVFSHAVSNQHAMKTVGERIRQAREYRGMSGEELALKVGYKTQSGISNLENRATGRGGFMLPKIAQVLDFSLNWFLEGPDYEDVKLVPPFASTSGHKASEPVSSYHTARDKAHRLIEMTSESGLVSALELLTLIQAAHPRENYSAGDSVPAPFKRSA